MQPLGRIKLRFPGKVDYHMHDKNGQRLANWWEGELQHSITKRAVKQRLKLEIRKELEDRAA